LPWLFDKCIEANIHQTFAGVQPPTDRSFSREHRRRQCITTGNVASSELFHLSGTRHSSISGHDGAHQRRTFLGDGSESCMEELNGRMIACQLLIAGLIARVANDQNDPVGFLSEFRDEIRAVVRGIRIAGPLDTDDVRATAVQTIDEMFSLMKPPSGDGGA
jgi:hypothetical protein